MRSLGFAKKRWERIKDGESFVMFRFDFEGDGHREQNKNNNNILQREENVQIVSHPSVSARGKSKNLETLGTAEVIGMSAVWVGSIPLSKYAGEEIVTNLTRADAVANGFSGVGEMRKWIKNRYGGLADKRPMYKLTLKKIAGMLKNE